MQSLPPILVQFPNCGAVDNFIWETSDRRFKKLLICKDLNSKSSKTFVSIHMLFPAGTLLRGSSRWYNWNYQRIGGYGIFVDETLKTV